MNEDTKLLERIRTPDDLRSLGFPELESLAKEIRTDIIETVAANGGHLAPNLGVVELAIALHRVFHAPDDHIVWDVGHQCYPHKLLTGRADRFHTIRKFHGLSGFTTRGESPYDCFGAGHAGTSISAAMGFSVAEELTGTMNHTVAVIGDGSLICGIPLEALNNLRCTCRKFIIVLNDNKMSISKSIGAIPNYLNQIITGQSYNRFKAFARMMIQKMPGGHNLVGNIRNLEASAKNLFVPGIFFEELGIRYVGPIDGHKLPDLVQTFERVKEFTRPVIVHVITEKGHGCSYAMAAPEKFHGIGCFHPDTGASIYGNAPKKTFSAAFGKKLFSMAKKDEKIVVVTAAMAAGCGISEEFIHEFPDRFFDVGIAEEHAVVFAAGLAAAGLRPFVAIYATFLQRALDCIQHDVCLQNLPVILCADRAGIVEDGPTHHGIYDIAFLRALPHLSILAPKNENELALMLDAAYEKASPVVIRYPRGNSGAPENVPDAAVLWGKAEVVREGPDLALWTFGREVYVVMKTAELLEAKYGLRATVVNARFLKPFDAELLRSHAAKMPVVTIEDNVTTGGLASVVSETLADSPHGKRMSFGWNGDEVIPHGPTVELRKAAGMYPEKLAENIAAGLREHP